MVTFAREYGLKIGIIADLIQYRSEHESIIQRWASARCTPPGGDFQAIAYRDDATGAPHLALVHGKLNPIRETLVHVHEPASLLDALDTGVSPHS